MLALPVFDHALFINILKITVIDLVLSGDNAVVIAMAVRSLPPDIARKASIFGAAGAVLLRVIFTAAATVLLNVPYLQAIGGAILFWIAYKLLIEEEEGEDRPGEIRDFWEAVRIIILADLVMSLDNILAVGGAAEGSLWLMVFGLLLSIPLVLGGSQVLAALLHRWPALAYIGSGILAWTAGRMIVHDEFLHKFLTGLAIPQFDLVLPGIATAIVLGAGFMASKRKQSEVAARADEPAAVPEAPVENR